MRRGEGMRRINVNEETRKGRRGAKWAERRIINYHLGKVCLAGTVLMEAGKC